MRFGAEKMRIELLSKKEKKTFIEQLEVFGIEKLPFTLVRTGKERIRAFSGDWDNEQIMDFWKSFHVEGVGLYLGKEMISKSGVRKARLSVDGMHTLKDQISKLIIQLTEEQAAEWFRGRDVNLNDEQSEEAKDFEGFIAVKFEDDFIGTANISADKKILYSFVPKERRIRDNT